MALTAHVSVCNENQEKWKHFTGAGERHQCNGAWHLDIILDESIDVMKIKRGIEVRRGGLQIFCSTVIVKQFMAIVTS